VAAAWRRQTAKANTASETAKSVDNAAWRWARRMAASAWRQRYGEMKSGVMKVMKGNNGVNGAA
jgi:hypothetical protein